MAPAAARPAAPAPGPFRYEEFEVDPAAAALRCHYSLGRHHFTETISFHCDDRGAADSDRPLGGATGNGTAAAHGHTGGGDRDRDWEWASPPVTAAARLVFLLAGVSYYKTAAPPVIDLGRHATSDAERAFLRRFYVKGLGEFANRNGLDLSGLEVVGPDRRPASPPAAGALTRPRASATAGAARPLVPFGGGIDSIVTAELVRSAHRGTALFVASRPGEPFAPLEQAAAVTGLPVVRALRTIDDKVLRPADHGFLTGHLPVTGIVSAVALLAAALTGRGPVVMANEWSASVGTDLGGTEINHQWSKSGEFEEAFRELLAQSPVPLPDWFSLLRGRSELWVARRFARLPGYWGAFRSCNRAFALDPARRAETWCGRCDKCCFIDLVLSPFMAAAELAAVFGGAEPLADPTLVDQFRALLGLGETVKPFECVGEVGECRLAAVMAAQREDRRGAAMLQALAVEAAAAAGGVDALAATAPALFGTAGPHHVPAGFVADEDEDDGAVAPYDLVV